MNRNVYHVLPKGDDWEVRLEGNKTNEGIYNRKVDAISRARDLAMDARLGQVIVHRRNGTIESESTYGEDPSHRLG